MIAVLFALVLSQGNPTQDWTSIEAKYGHKVEVRKVAFTNQAQGYKVEGDAATSAAMEKYTPLWIKEWSRYSAGIMAKAKVVKIVFCEKLSLNGQSRAAVPAFDLNTMYFDPALGSYAPDYQRSVIHHEFFHMMDYRMGKMRIDPEWFALNPKGFKYGTGGEKMRTSGVGNLTTEIAGFLTPYGTSAIEEDKAELFAHLIVSTKFVVDQASKDAVLASKIALLKKRLESYDAGLNADFWPKL